MSRYQSPSIKPRDLKKVLNKFKERFDVSEEGGDHVYVKLTFAGTLFAWTKYSLGSKPSPADLISKQLFINVHQLNAAVSCTFGSKEYLNVLITKKKITPPAAGIEGPASS